MLHCFNDGRETRPTSGAATWSGSKASRRAAGVGRIAAVVGKPEMSAAAIAARGTLADVAPAVMELVGVDGPAAMTGRSLLRRAAPPQG